MRSIQTALAMLREKTWMPYLIGQDYMGTLQELVLAGAYACFGYSGFLTRLSMVILFAFATALYFFGFRNFLSRRAAAVGTLLIALSTSSQLNFTVPSTPDYNLSYLLGAALPLVAFAYAESRGSLKLQILFAGLAGLAVYTYSLLTLNLAVCVGWLWFHSPGFRPLEMSLKHSFQASPRRWILGAGTIGASFIAGLSLSFLFLARGGLLIRPNHQKLDLSLAVFSFCTLLIGIFLLFPLCRLLGIFLFQRLNLLLVASLAVFVFVPKFWYRAYWAAWAHDYNLDFWTVAYSLVNPSQIRSQLRLLTSSVVPTLLEGRMRRVITVTVAAGQGSFPMSTDALVVTAVFSAVLALGLYFLYRSLKGASGDGKLALYYLPVVATLLILVPSWRLNGVYSYRYLLLSLPGIFAVVALAYQYAERNTMGLRIFSGLLLIYLLYSGGDVLGNVPVCLVSQSVAYASREIDQHGIQVVAGVREDLIALQYLRGNRSLYYDLSDRPMPGLFTRPDVVRCVSRIGFLDVTDERREQFLTTVGIAPKTGIETAGKWKILTVQHPETTVQAHAKDVRSF